jgi:hypothetical protein
MAYFEENKIASSSFSMAVPPAKNKAVLSTDKGTVVKCSKGCICQVVRRGFPNFSSTYSNICRPWPQIQICLTMSCIASGFSQKRNEAGKAMIMVTRVAPEPLCCLDSLNQE